jgi:hypothetical protein
MTSQKIRLRNILQPVQDENKMYVTEKVHLDQASYLRQ